MATKSELENELIELINRAAQERADADISAVPAIVPMPDGNIVLAQDASPEQWERALKGLIEPTVSECADKLDCCIELLISRAAFSPKRE